MACVERCRGARRWLAPRKLKLFAPLSSVRQVALLIRTAGCRRGIPRSEGVGIFIRFGLWLRCRVMPCPAAETAGRQGRPVRSRCASAPQRGLRTRPAARSRSNSTRARSRCRSSGSARLRGSIVTRSFCPLPSRTVIWLCWKSTSLTRRPRTPSGAAPHPTGGWPSGAACLPAGRAAP